MDEFSVCFSDPLMVDMDLFSMWVDGYKEHEASKRFSTLITASVNDIPFSILQLEVSEQYTSFKYLETFLQSPTLLNSPILSSLSPEQKESLLEHYYDFNKDVMREILGKKMSAKLRKDMDDVSEKTGISLHSCRRQFDNVKNILRTFEDMEESLNDVLKNHFLFSDTLVNKYYPLVFVFLERFETSKKRLNYLTYDDIIISAEYITEKWTYHAESLTNGKLTDPEEIDRNFVQDLRDLHNTVTERDFQDLHRGYMLARLEKKATTLHFKKSVDSNFRAISRNIFHIGGNLTHSKDVRDFFNDCVEKVVEPVKQLEWAYKEFDMFLNLLLDSWGDFKDEHRNFARKYDTVFIRYMEVMKKCLLQLYK